MIDLHCHILPHIDDGSPNTEVSVLMARMAFESGIDAIVATPHCNLLPDQPNYNGEELEQRLHRLSRRLRQEQIPVQLLSGAEIFATWNLDRLLQQQKLPTLNHSRYLLLEFRFSMEGQDMNTLLETVQQFGLVPVIAHPERYDAVQQDPSLAAYWFRHGYVLQGNKGSILGKLGRGAYYAGRWLLEHGFYHVLATDAHHFEIRSPYMGELMQELTTLCPMSYQKILLSENPRRIVDDRPLCDPQTER